MQRKNRIVKKVNNVLMIIVSLFILVMAAGCSKKGEEVSEIVDNAAAVGIESDDISKHGAEEFYNTYIYQNSDDIYVLQEGNYFVNGVELCDALEQVDGEDELWEGYSEQELGLLTPDKMPNVVEANDGCHGVWYNDVLYMYVNDVNEIYGESGGMAEFANVWFSTDTRKVLGDWEEYGKKCAEEGNLLK